MSYDLYLRDPVTKDVLTVPGHMMFGGNIPCKVVNHELVPCPSTEAYLNITYNYSSYYYEAFPEREKNPEQYEKDREEFGLTSEEGGIRSLNGMTGLQASKILEEMIRRIESNYKKPDGTWVVTERTHKYLIDRETGKKKDCSAALDHYFALRKQGLSTEVASKAVDERYEEGSEEIFVDEGSGGNDYWLATAANAIRPLHQLIILSHMRPDGVWSEES